MMHFWSRQSSMLGKFLWFSWRRLQQSRYFLIAWPGWSLRMSSFAFFANLKSLKSLKFKSGGDGKFPVHASHSQTNPYSSINFDWRSAFGCLTKLALKINWRIYCIKIAKKSNQLTCSSRRFASLSGSAGSRCKWLSLRRRLWTRCWHSCGWSKIQKVRHPFRLLDSSC